MFPEDYLISVEKLKWFWIAEDFIQGEGRAEDIAEDYLIELMDRSLIQVAENFWGNTYKCRIHDLLRDVAVEKAKEVNLFDIYDPNKSTSSRRRQAIHNHIGKYLPFGSSHRILRSMLLFNPDYQESVKIGLLDFTCQRFRYLRVLDLENVKCRFHSGSRSSSHTLGDIGNLVHLKYLGLTNTNLSQLPKSKLKSLQVLELCSN